MTKIIYLDQSHPSRMAKARMGRTKDVEALELLGVLQPLVSSGRAICPFSFWHVVECVGFEDDEVRFETCAVLDELSRGRCFRSWSDLAPEELAATHGGSKPKVLSTNAACFPSKFGPEPTARAAGFALLTGAGFLGLAVGSLSRLRAKSMTETFKTITTADFEAELAASRTSATPTEKQAWTRAVGSWAEVLGVGPIPDDASFRSLVATGQRTLATIARFAAAALRNETRHATPSDVVDICHVGHLAYSDWFLTDRHVRERSHRWAQDLGARVHSEPDELANELRAEFTRPSAGPPSPSH